MTSISVLAKFGAAFGAMAAPAMLLLGAGTAHADRTIQVWGTSAPGGVDVWVQSNAGGGDTPISGWCTYTSTVQGDPIGKPAPALGVPFFLPVGAPARLWFPAWPTGSTWNTTVSCPNGVVSTQSFW